MKAKEMNSLEDNKSNGNTNNTVLHKLGLSVHYRIARRFARKSKRAIFKTMRGVGQEALETKEMAHSFFRLLESKLDLTNRIEPPTQQEVKEAFEQLKDVGRFSVFAGISILPGGGFSLIGLELLARKFGVKNFTFVPSAFRKK